MNQSARTPQDSSLSRRQVLTTGVWAAPALLLATAAPAAAAASQLGDAPAAALTPLALALEDTTGGQHTGQLRWEGGQVTYAYSSTGPNVAQVPWVATVLYPGESVARALDSGVLTVTRYGRAEPTGSILFGTPPMPAGLYTVTFTIFAVGGVTKSSATTYNLVR